MVNEKNEPPLSVNIKPNFDKLQMPTIELGRQFAQQQPIDDIDSISQIFKVKMIESPQTDKSGKGIKSKEIKKDEINIAEQKAKEQQGI